ncbi:hypothetical protein DFH06DRAFT_1446712 [Mycena polygramma]|nr:hypothetical protein DFH06DRAFT_1446712 [Mycena polygramma]
MTLMSIDARLTLLRQTLKAGLPATAGVHPVNTEDLILYYDVEEKPNRIHFGNATEQKLSNLSGACQQSEAHSNGNTAGTMDTKKFTTRLDVVASGLLEAVSADVLQGANADGNKLLKSQLTGLNVYGPGDSINKHNETLHGNYMIGTLVVIFPIPHVGGRVLVKHEDAPFSLDPASELAAASTPAIWYMAFYGDVPHMVEPLVAGHRVSLTYNLLLVDPSVPAVQPLTPTATERRLEDTLRALLADPAFLPAGGFLASGLAHKYLMPCDPIDAWGSYDTSIVPEQRWGAVLRALKGADARLRTVSTSIGLVPFVRPLYAPDSDYEDCDFLLDDLPDFSGVHEGFEAMSEDEGKEIPGSMREIARAGTLLGRDAQRLEETKPPPRSEYMIQFEREKIDLSGGRTAVAVHWLSKLGQQNCMRTPYVGHDSMVTFAIGTPALFIRVPAAGEGIRSA